MRWQSTPYELPLVLAALTCACIAAYAWRHRPAAGTRPLTVLLLATAVWCLSDAFALASVELPAKLGWDTVASIGVQVVPLAWLAFALEYSGREPRLTPRRMALLAAEPMLVLVILFMGDPFHLMRSGAHLGNVGAFTVLVAQHGVLFWLNVAYSYGLVLLGTALLWPLLEGLFHPNAFYRGQASMLLIAVLAPWIANVLSITGLTHFTGLDLTPFAFTLSGAALAWSVLHYRLLDVIPVARDTLIESMGDAVLVLDASGRIVDLNPAARALLDRPSSAVMGQPIANLIPQGEHAIWRTPGALRGSGTDGAEERTELMLPAGATSRWFDVRVSPLRDPSGTLTGRLVVLDEITARVLAEQALRDSEERARMIFEQAPIGMALLDLSNRFLKVNRALCDMLGYAEGELSATRLDALMHPDDAGKSALLDTQAERGALTSYAVEQRYLKKNRETVWAQLTMTLIRAAGAPAYRLAMIESIFERKRAELLEDEKRHMAYELHDGLAQITAGAHLYLQAFAGHHRPRSPEARAELGRALALAQRAAREARHVIAELRPTVVEELGLATALRMQVEALRAEHWEVSYDERLGSERLPIALETAIFRVAMEALTNVRKHAQTMQVRITVEREAARVRLEVRDCGRGFDADAPRDDDRVGHIGMSEMRDRIALLGGRLSIESRPGEGTRMVAEAPIPATAIAEPEKADGSVRVLPVWERDEPPGGRPGNVPTLPQANVSAGASIEVDGRGGYHG